MKHWKNEHANKWINDQTNKKWMNGWMKKINNG